MIIVNSCKIYMFYKIFFSKLDLLWLTSVYVVGVKLSSLRWQPWAPT